MKIKVIVCKVNDSGCWLWTGGKHKWGYGMAVDRNSKPKRVVSVPRLVLEAKLRRPMKPKMMAMHDCDVPACVNPDHISEGTHEDNMRHMAERNRSPNAKLTSNKVRQIRELLDIGARQVDIAKQFDVGRSAIHSIKHGRVWAHLT